MLVSISREDGSQEVIGSCGGLSRLKVTQVGGCQPAGPPSQHGGPRAAPQSVGVGGPLVSDMTLWGLTALPVSAGLPQALLVETCSLLSTHSYSESTILNCACMHIKCHCLIGAMA